MNKKQLIVICFVIQLINFKIVTIQRNEIMYSIVKIIFNDQILLKIVFRNIRFELRKMHRLIREKKKSRIKWFRDVDFLIFQFFINRVILWIIKRINSKWITIVATIQRIRKNKKTIISRSCNCEFVVRYDLFCKYFHYFLRIAIENFFISIILLYFRWRLNDSKTNLRNWQSRYFDSKQFDDFINRDNNRNCFVNNTINQQIFYDRLSKNKRDILINQIVDFTKNVILIYDVFAKMKTNIFEEFFKSSSTKKKL